jgi:hypothetical protein
VQFRHQDLTPTALEHLHLFGQTLAPRRHLVAVHLPVDDLAAHLVADEEQDGKEHTHHRRGDEIDEDRDPDDARDHSEVEDGRALPREGEALPVEHPESHHEQQGGQGRDGRPGENGAEQEVSEQGHDARDHP